MTATKFRQNLYAILDQVLSTGIPVEIERNGKTLLIEARQTPPKWDRLEPHETLKGDPEDIVHIDWSDEWKGQNP